jgi:hypothetical protein
VEPRCERVWFGSVQGEPVAGSCSSGVLISAGYSCGRAALGERETLGWRAARAIPRGAESVLFAATIAMRTFYISESWGALASAYRLELPAPCGERQLCGGADRYTALARHCSHTCSSTWQANTRGSLW